MKAKLYNVQHQCIFHQNMKYFVQYQCKFVICTLSSTFLIFVYVWYMHFYARKIETFVSFSSKLKASSKGLPQGPGDWFSLLRDSLQQKNVIALTFILCKILFLSRYKIWKGKNFEKIWFFVIQVFLSIFCVDSEYFVYI